MKALVELKSPSPMRLLTIAMEFMDDKKYRVTPMKRIRGVWRINVYKMV